MPCDYTGSDLLGVVWSVATPLGNSFNLLQFIGSIMLCTINLSTLYILKLNQLWLHGSVIRYKRCSRKIAKQTCKAWGAMAISFCFFRRGKVALRDAAKFYWSSHIIKSEVKGECNLCICLYSLSTEYPRPSFNRVRFLKIVILSVLNFLMHIFCFRDGLQDHKRTSLQASKLC